MTTAMLFPGQGSQAIGMMASLGERYESVPATFADASAVLGYDLWNLCQQGPEDRLNQTEVTQPAMLAAGIATWRLWIEQGGARPTLMAGHSLGEYAALVAADAMAFADAVGLVALRGRLMQQAVPAGSGAMAAILGLDDEQVVTACIDAAEGEVVSAANFNAPGQVVIAGQRDAVQRAIEAAQSAGARRAIMLPVSVPSHCALMIGAAEGLREALTGITVNAPSCEVLQNYDVAAHDTPDAIRNALVAQLYSPVRWTETVQRMAGQGVEQFAECGPGKVLAGLNRRIDRSRTCMAITDPAGLDSALEAWS